MEYKGITPEALFLLADNRFRNSKEYYESRKEEIKSSVTEPMRQLAGLIGGELLSVDPLMNTIPTRMVSRVRRDTRYTNDKSLYRDNMWIMFMRPKNEWRGYPCMWFEVTQSAYSLGVGLYGSEAGLMQVFRKALRERGDEFLAAAAKCKKADAVLSASTYKRMPPDCPKGLEEFYGCKEMYFIKFSGALDDLGDDRIIKIMRDTYKAYTPMYKFLLSVSDEYFEKE